MAPHAHRDPPSPIARMLMPTAALRANGRAGLLGPVIASVMVIVLAFVVSLGCYLQQKKKKKAPPATQAQAAVPTAMPMATAVPVATPVVGGQSEA